MSGAFVHSGGVYGSEVASLLRQTADRIEEFPDSVYQPGGCGPQGIRKLDGTIVVVEAGWRILTTDLPMFDEHDPHGRAAGGAA